MTSAKFGYDEIRTDYYFSESRPLTDRKLLISQNKVKALDCFYNGIFNLITQS